ncbi:glycosyltransferase [Winogradskyella ouciana]|uniref:Glycosyltransferase n=1 Tax=Winogradskyella ouciana TaxID=2608631 RepID=A0A7K1GE33_9FLAO|nr:glycosyltransferase [Winogradskyella ouciana]MTE27403.1 glycosyltransferase [Winogradskyella ouciana]
MHVIQIIDSLNSGGAERVAVNIANQLVGKTEKSFLCTTREEGALKEELSEDVTYFFLNRTKTLDISAIRNLRDYIKINEIDIIHAHASSYFISTIIKILLPKVKLIWHDHLGNRSEVKSKTSFVLKASSYFFNGVIAVNKNLAEWANNNLKADKIEYIPNFTVKSKVKGYTTLKGVDDKRILYLANLRHPKNHLFLFKVFSEIVNEFSDWTLHLVGKDYNDNYSKKIKSFIDSKNLESHIFLLDQRKDVSHIIDQCSIGVITSTYEGLPMALLEYGLGNLAVVSTDVGQCKEVISDYGIVVDPQSHSVLKEALIALMSNEKLRTEKGSAFNEHINQNYGAEKILKSLMEIYSNI